jgi:preprotein translocase subunit SecG
MTTVLLIVQIFLVLVLIGVILMQKTGADSLAGLSGSSNQMFASRSSGNTLSKITFILAFCFIANCLVIGKIINSDYQKKNAVSESIMQLQQDKKIVPEAPEVTE